MGNCCNDKSCTLDQLQSRQGATLWLVLVLNAVMFMVELAAGLMAGSVSLLADSLDMLGDALVYAFSLWVVGRGALWKARAAVSKAAVMAAFGLFVAGEVVYKLLAPQPPSFETMGEIGSLALAVNTLCFAVLWRHRAEDINMRSVWLCSRNDLFANLAVLLAALAVWRTASPWPDIVVGAFICGLFLHSAWVVAKEARRELRTAHDPLRTRP
ncbi:MAG: cation transporter [Hydrogenophilales bacterium CG03_land_8_20_14_0_80_62_28]|nr:cation transporter [Betaproteobacteria bacterium]OIO77272.1 MAG: cation transporter [Hydrogenophilaceae bacterium CG1_02_62_390]PIV21397.1 MAG: cation transporter [Hydrogenophilales bacterium CG03_land_8_20_14_0_80_62_28]PIW38243.1 MAG: cation transporter [Hydrogenophilales bacterium CG15_BIG_FIL_POST_REV_8_21_14_020_62_31]PIW71848.1 MAG: cation transporter [Hydrogenophilales bacterium CG12_big_fil_rev_8_21_14_0_65_61_21]PIX01872.1 MAG: cation transporter [Hydrogenophilales bacterium CG_4_8